MPQLRSPRIWGTLATSGGVGATTLTLHLAQVASRSGVRTLLIESDLRAPLREILPSAPPFWEEYQGQSSIPERALPRPLATGFALLTRRSAGEIKPELYRELIEIASENFDLILIDQPMIHLEQINPLLVLENSLPSLIGLNVLAPIYKPQIVVINKFSPRLKKRPAIQGFITDAHTFKVPKSEDLQLALGYGITRKLTAKNEQLFNTVLAEILN